LPIFKEFNAQGDFENQTRVKRRPVRHFSLRVTGNRVYTDVVSSHNDHSRVIAN
jgi:hypothetical protein